jgi:hypothetical protein
LSMRSNEGADKCIKDFEETHGVTPFTGGK